MDLTVSVHKILRVAAATGGLLVLACLQAGPANSGSNQLFTEKWQQQFQCKNPGGGQECRVVAGGNFNVKTTFLGTSCVPSDLERGAGSTIDIFVGNGTTGASSFDSTSGVEYFDDDVGDDFGIKVFSNKTVATQKRTVQVCNPPNSNCKFVNFEKVQLTVNSSGDLTIAFNATTGENFNGDFFENSIDAENFVGQPSGPVSDMVTLDVSLNECFDSGDLPVAVNGKVKTTKPSNSKPALSSVNIKGTL
jgi:hypothetical protein